MPLGHLCADCGDLTTEPVAGRCARCAPGYLAREQRRRNNHPRRLVYLHPRWRLTRLAVFRRDRFTCRRCGARPREGRGLVCDHVDPIEQIVAEGRNPFNPSECQTLCASCSGSKDGGRGAAKRPRR